METTNKPVTSYVFKYADKYIHYNRDSGCTSLAEKVDDAIQFPSPMAANTWANQYRGDGERDQDSNNWWLEPHIEVEESSPTIEEPQCWLPESCFGNECVPATLTELNKLMSYNDFPENGKIIFIDEHLDFSKVKLTDYFWDGAHWVLFNDIGSTSIFKIYKSASDDDKITIMLSAMTIMRMSDELTQDECVAEAIRDLIKTHQKLHGIATR